MAGNEVLLDVLVTNAYKTAGTSQKGVLNLLAFHTPGDTITLSWNGHMLVFTCVTYTGAPFTYPVNSGGESILTWGEKVFMALASNYDLANDFMISGQPETYKYEINFIPFVKQSYNNLTIQSTGTVQIINSSYTPDVLYDNYKLQLQLMQETLAGEVTMRTKARSAVYPPLSYTGRDASLKYDIGRLIYSDSGGHFTFPENGIRHAQDIIQKYYLRLSFVADNMASESLPIDHYFHVLPGKMSETKEKALNTSGSNIYAELASTKRFLTFAPPVKNTDIYSPEKLYFLFLTTYMSLRLKITERFTNSPAETRILQNFAGSAFTVHEFSVGFQTIKQEDYGSKILSEYDIWIETSGGSLISERRTFRIDYGYQRMARYFLFMNSFGVYELFRATGDAFKVNKVDKEFYNRVIHQKTDRDQARKPIGIEQVYSMKVNSGFIEDPWNFYYPSELLGSRDVFWLKNNRAYAVQVEGSEVELSKTDLDNLHDFDFLVTLDDMDDTFFQEFLPGSELPVLGDFNNDFSDDFNR